MSGTFPEGWDEETKERMFQKLVQGLGLRFIMAGLEKPEHISVDDIKKWEKKCYDDPEAIGPYSDWLEEQGWIEYAEYLRR